MRFNHRLLLHKNRVFTTADTLDGLCYLLLWHTKCMVLPVIMDSGFIVAFDGIWLGSVTHNRIRILLHTKDYVSRTAIKTRGYTNNQTIV